MPSLPTPVSPARLVRWTLASLLLGACQEPEPKDFLSPVDPSQIVPILASVRIAPEFASLRAWDTVRFTATGISTKGEPMAVVVDWQATGGSITSDGLFTAQEPGQQSVTARVRTQPSFSAQAMVGVWDQPTDVIAVTVTPGSVQQVVGEGVQFEAQVRLAGGATSSTHPLIWFATGGAVDGSGWYIASREGSYTVRAAAVNGVSGGATVVVTPPIRTLLGIDVQPEAASLAAGAERDFAALEVWSDGSTADADVEWSSTGGTVTPVAGSGGKVSGGKYKAGSTHGKFKVQARQRNGSLTDSAVVTIVAPTVVAITITPSSATLSPGASQTFAAAARHADGTTAAASVTWSATGGTISQGGGYTAGTSAGSYQVVAVLSGGTLADTAEVTISAPPPPAATLTQVILNPSSATIPAGDSRQLTVTGLWSDGSQSTPPVTWNATGGTVSSSGRYTAGSTPGSYRVIATAGNGVADTAAVTVGPAELRQLTLTPATPALQPGGTQQFTVAGQWSDGSTSAPAVTWTAQGGTITSSGLYTAGTASGTYSVIARHTGGTLADTSFVTISQPPPTLLSLTVSPASPSLQTGGTRQFTVSGVWSDASSSVPSVTWTAAGGSISAGGLYTAGNTAGAFRVIATHTASAKADTAEVTITAPPTLTGLVVSPGSVSLVSGATQQFTATGTYSNGSTATPAVTWSATGGTISSAGLYTAGSTAGTSRVVATSAGIADTATVVIGAPAPTLTGVLLTPASVTLNSGATQQFTAVGQYSNGTTGSLTIAWTATGGSITPSGLYTAGTTGGAYRVIARHSTGTLADTSVVTINGPTVTQFSLTPASVTLTVGGTQQFSTSATWSDGVSRPVTVSYAATGGTVSSSGLYTAGLIAGTFSVIASCSCGRADTSQVTIQSGDTAPPVISNGQPTGVLTAGTSQTTMSVTTDEAATCKWGTSSGTVYANLANTFSTTGSTAHSTPLTGLVNGQSYVRYVRCRDQTGNATTADYSVTFSVASGGSPPPAGSVVQWRRLALAFANTTYTGNPFELGLDATFRHTATGTTLTLPGYYAGGDTWKVGFMPTLTGEWTYTTSSPDPDLAGRTGTVTAIASGLPGLLKADPTAARKWRFADGTSVVPIALRTEFFSEPASLSQFTAAADFLMANNIQMMETRLWEEYGQFGGRHDFIFSGDWQNHQFDLTIWDRMEARMEGLTERGLGAHIMFYSDGGGSTRWGGQTATEALVIRYTVARLAGYPVVLFNTGIDIDEYRSQADVDWLGQQFRSLDPYGHPISSRRGGGSGTILMSGQLFDSRGNNQARIGEMTNIFNASSVPVSVDDAWGEDRPSHPDKNFRPADIRRAFWKAVIVGGVGGLIRSDGGGCGFNGAFHFGCMAQDLESEQWLRLVNPFVQQRLGDTFRTMVPAPSLVDGSGGKSALADPARAKILYFLIGQNDQWDSGDGASITVRLGGLGGTYRATWFDPRTGNETSAGDLPGGGDRQLTPPTGDDWVLLLAKL